MTDHDRLAGLALEMVRRMKPLCAGRDRDPEWWCTGNDGNRLALLICRPCPLRLRCIDGDPHPRGVVRGGVAFNDKGNALPVCWCGYPMTNWRTNRPVSECLRCRVPNVKIAHRRVYDRERYQRRKAATA